MSVLTTYNCLPRKPNMPQLSLRLAVPADKILPRKVNRSRANALERIVGLVPLPPAMVCRRVY